MMFSHVMNNNVIWPLVDITQTESEVLFPVLWTLFWRLYQAKEDVQFTNTLLYYSLYCKNIVYDSTNTIYL